MFRLSRVAKVRAALPQIDVAPRIASLQQGIVGDPKPYINVSSGAFGVNQGLEIYGAGFRLGCWWGIISGSEFRV